MQEVAVVCSSRGLTLGISKMRGVWMDGCDWVQCSLCL